MMIFISIRDYKLRARVGTKAAPSDDTLSFKSFYSNFSDHFTHSSGTTLSVSHLTWLS